jgi:hypothetical protein
MKPQFHDSLTVSPRLITLLDGLLEPSAKQRIASPDRIREILEGRSGKSQTSGATTQASVIPKPPWTKIERIELANNAVRFRIPKRLMKIIPGQTVLDLSAETVKFLDAYKIGKKLGQSWTLSTPELRPSDITWYFDHEKPVIGINARGTTYIISSSLALAEIHWLVQEIRGFIAGVQIALLPEDSRKRLETSGTDPLFLPIVSPAKPKDTRIQQSGDTVSELMLRIPRRLLPPSVTLKSSFQEDLLEFLSLFLGRRTIEISPTWIQLSTSYFGLKLGRAYHIPTASVRASDINWFYKKVSSGGESSLQRLVVGLNYGGRTVELASQLNPEEAEWLIHEVRQYITNYAQSTFESEQNSDFDMH